MISSSRQQGFTLIEVMIAVSVTAMMGLMVLGTFRQVDRAHEITRDQGDRYAGACLALDRIARELSMAYISDHYDKTTSRALRERPSAFIGKDDDLLFTTFSHERLARDVHESDQQVVQYTLGSDPEHPGEQALLRRQKARIDEEIEREGRKDVVADYVSSFRVLYFDARKNDWARDWSTKSTDHQNELPSRVRVELEVKLPSGRTEKLVTEARIMLTRVLDF